MVTLVSTEYDGCRNWIKMKRNKSKSWEEIRLACKENEEELLLFIERRKDEDDWPVELTIDIWNQLVSEIEEAEQKKLQIQRDNRSAFLVNKQEPFKVKISDDENSCWQLYKKCLYEKKHFSDESIKNIESSSIRTLSCLRINTESKEPVKGLVIGNVQSGKTANMTGLIAMAADLGWNMFIVLSGTIESLRKQTQERIFSDLNNSGTLVWTSFEHLSKRSSPGNRLHDLQLQNGCRRRYLTVCLKVKSRLENLIDWIEEDTKQIQNLKVLVIDDEADQASINTAKLSPENERKTINRLILNLVHCRDKKAKNSEKNKYKSHYGAMNYISYTATPYANCLNEIGPETLYPKDFIHVLNPAKSYFGPSRFFRSFDIDDNRNLNIVRSIPEEDKKIINKIQNGEIFYIPESLKDSIKWFLCAAGIMRFQGYKKPVSMLIHTSQKQKHHSLVANSIKKWLCCNKEIILKDCENLYKRETKLFTKKELRAKYPEYEYSNEDIWDYPLFSDIKDNIKELLEKVSSIKMNDENELTYSRGIHLCIDNCANNGVDENNKYKRLAYPREFDNINYATVFLVIGGNTLSRGLTLKGLVSTFFLRITGQADTLMQMGRWFGYRPHYELLQRVWMTDDTIDKFRFLADVDADLREQIYQMQVVGMGPKDFNLALLSSPKARWLSLTARNKSQMAVSAEIDFSGMDIQLTVYSKDSSDQIRNINATNTFLKSLNKKSIKSENNAAYIWKDVPFKQIRTQFFDKGFSVPETSKAFQQIDLLEEWVKKQTEKGLIGNWNVIVVGKQISREMRSDDIWELPNGSKLAKINRSYRSESKDRINIGVLSSKKHFVADIREEDLDEQHWRKLLSISSMGNNYQDYRRFAHVDKIPLFLIYRINKSSEALTDNRFSLNLANDLIGITMVIPGIRGANKVKTRLKIKSIDCNQESGE